MRGASALNELLAEFPDDRFRVHAVWEPVLATDVAAPVTQVLGLLDDQRVTQYWDPEQIVSADIVRAVNQDPARYGLKEALPPGFIAWDVVAVFPGSARWERDLPPPAYYAGPVADEIEGTRKALVDVLATPPQAAAVQYLLTAAATDFHTHRPPDPVRFRDVRVGHVKTPGGEDQYILCGQFLPAQEGSNAEWTPFATIKTSGYEQWIGAQATGFCQGASILWDKESDLSSSLQSRLDSLR